MKNIYGHNPVKLKVDEVDVKFDQAEFLRVALTV